MNTLMTSVIGVFFLLAVASTSLIEKYSPKHMCYIDTHPWFSYIPDLSTCTHIIFSDQVYFKLQLSQTIIEDVIAEVILTREKYQGKKLLLEINAIDTYHDLMNRKETLMSFSDLSLFFDGFLLEFNTFDYTRLQNLIKYLQAWTKNKDKLFYMRDSCELGSHVCLAKFGLVKFFDGVILNTYSSTEKGNLLAPTKSVNYMEILVELWLGIGFKPYQIIYELNPKETFVEVLSHSKNKKMTTNDIKNAAEIGMVYAEDPLRYVDSIRGLVIPIEEENEKYKYLDAKQMIDASTTYLRSIHAGGFMMRVLPTDAEKADVLLDQFWPNFKRARGTFVG